MQSLYYSHHVIEKECSGMLKDDSDSLEHNVYHHFLTMTRQWLYTVLHWVEFPSQTSLSGFIQIISSSVGLVEHDTNHGHILHKIRVTESICRICWRQYAALEDLSRLVWEAQLRASKKRGRGLKMKIGPSDYWCDLLQMKCPIKLDKKLGVMPKLLVFCWTHNIFSSTLSSSRADCLHIIYILFLFSLLIFRLFSSLGNKSP